MNRAVWQVLHGLWWIILFFAAADVVLAVHRHRGPLQIAFWAAVIPFSLWMIYWTARKTEDS